MFRPPVDPALKEAQTDSMSNQRPLSYDPAALRRAFADAGSGLVDIVAALPAERLDEQAMGLWTLRDLVGHASRAIGTVPIYLEGGVGLAVETDHPYDYFNAYRSSHGDSVAIAERARQSGRDLGDDLVGGVKRLLDTANAALAMFGDEAPTNTPAGVMRLADYLPARIFELVVHGEDIKVACNLELVPAQGAVTVALTFAAGLAAESPQFRTALFGLTGRGGLAPDFTVI